MSEEKNEGTLSNFKEEVLDQGAESCLPKNLSHYWLNRLSAQAAAMLEDGSSPTDQKCSEIIAALICILFYKNGHSESLEVCMDELFEYCKNYAIELSLEEAYRKTEIKYEAATLDTILTLRDVKVWKA